MVAVLFRKPAKDHPNGLEFEVLLDKLSEEGDWLKVRATYQKRFQTVTKQQKRVRTTPSIVVEMGCAWSSWLCSRLGSWRIELRGSGLGGGGGEPRLLGGLR